MPARPETGLHQIDNPIAKFSQAISSVKAGTFKFSVFSVSSVVKKWVVGVSPPQVLWCFSLF